MGRYPSPHREMEARSSMKKETYLFQTPLSESFLISSISILHTFVEKRWRTWAFPFLSRIAYMIATMTLSKQMMM